MFKRILDFLVALLILIVFSPLMVVIYFSVMIFMGRPVIFKQDRPGLNGSIFSLCKFRTMTVGNTHDSLRLTPFGKLLRLTSLDELPGLFNVLKGDMSLVGPRPLLVEYLPLYNVHQARRHEVRPGITGWAQVNGRNAISWEKKFELDVWYVDNRSLWLDIKILLLTVKKVFVKEGISAEGHVTAEPFKGNSHD
ncbi:sugar transferase [Shewanella sp. Isolate8]|uniref:sugar transferase n=1 Tax=Shewanella sp. Isolate8 TaxID=2908529 RepID=UPI001EFC9BF6|nr:sugar transferase [Shewanella sp. Isolate8]MCG9745904.1 sugar transferase [Shewanella sp. Isolate8]